MLVPDNYQGSQSHLLLQLQQSLEKKMFHSQRYPPENSLDPHHHLHLPRYNLAIRFIQMGVSSPNEPPRSNFVDSVDFVVL